MFNVRWLCMHIKFAVFVNEKHSKNQKHKSRVMLMSTKVFAVASKLKLSTVNDERDLLSHVIPFSQVELFIILPNSFISNVDDQKHQTDDKTRTVKANRHEVRYQVLTIGNLMNDNVGAEKVSERFFRSTTSYLIRSRFYCSVHLKNGKNVFYIKALSGKVKRAFFTACDEKST